MTNNQPARPRICFMLQVKPDLLDEYRRRHAAVWPDMIAALQRTGWHNYSLFSSRPPGSSSATSKPTTSS